MLVFDLTKQSTFDNLKKWYKELREHSDENIMLILIGNKCDLDSQRVISKDQAASFAEEYGMAYLETSALETINVDKSFMQLVQCKNEMSNYIFMHRCLTLSSTSRRHLRSRNGRQNVDRREDSAEDRWQTNNLSSTSRSWTEQTSS